LSTRDLRYTTLLVPEAAVPGFTVNLEEYDRTIFKSRIMTPCIMLNNSSEFLYLDILDIEISADIVDIISCCMIGENCFDEGD